MMIYVKKRQHWYNYKVYGEYGEDLNGKQIFDNKITSVLLFKNTPSSIQPSPEIVRAVDLSCTLRTQGAGTGCRSQLHLEKPG